MKSSTASPISKSGQLKPGYYTLDMEVHSRGYIHSSGSGAPTQGTDIEEASIDVTFTVNHNGS